MVLLGLSRGRARRAAAVASDDAQGGGREPRPRRRQGGDHGARPTVADRRRGATRRCSTSATPSRRSTGATSPPRTSGTSSRDMSVIAERTDHVAGLARSRGGSGDPSPLTALGVEVAIGASCERAFSERSLRGRRICVIGLGHVGSRVAKRCARAGAELVVADLDERKRTLAEQLGARWTSPEEALVADVDVLVPCALGGQFDDETVPRLRCRVVAGAANNQLARRSGSRTYCRPSGVLWAPDFVVNAGGLINIAEEVGGYDPAHARAAGGIDRRDAARDLRAGRRGPDDAAGGGVKDRRPAPSGVKRPTRRSRDAATPSGRRPSPASLSRWAASVTVAAGRRCSGTSAQAASSISWHRARAVVEGRDQAPLAIEPVRDVLVELALRIVHRAARGPGTGARGRGRGAVRARPGSRRARPDRGR